MSLSLAPLAVPITTPLSWPLAGQAQISPCFLLVLVYGVELFMKVAGLGPLEYLSSGWNL